MEAGRMNTMISRELWRFVKFMDLSEDYTDDNFGITEDIDSKVISTLLNFVKGGGTVIDGHGERISMENGLYRKGRRVCSLRAVNNWLRQNWQNVTCFDKKDC